MNRHHLTLAGATLGILLLSGCGGSQAAAPTATVTKTMTVMPSQAATDTVTHTATPTPTQMDDELAGAALEGTWRQMSDAHKRRLCSSWSDGPLTHQEMIEALESGAGSKGALFDDQHVEAFFDLKCGSGRPTMLRRLWNQLDTATQDSMCHMWVNGPMTHGDMVEMYREGGEELVKPYSDEEIAGFFTEQCGS